MCTYSVVSVSSVIFCCSIISRPFHYNDGIMSSMVSEFTSVSFVCSIVCSSADKRKHKTSASIAFARRIHRLPVDFPHKGLVTWKPLPWTRVFQWQSSGNTVCLEFRPQCTWNATGERNVGGQCVSSVFSCGLPVAFQWSSSVFQ